jgi:hypothetical protein
MARPVLECDRARKLSDDGVTGFSGLSEGNSTTRGASSFGVAGN